MYHSTTYSHRSPERNPSNIDLFLYKNMSYIWNCYTVDELSSNLLPIILELENVNIVKKDKTIIKTDWSKYTKNTNKWKIQHQLDNAETIDECIQALQDFLHKLLHEASIRSKYNNINNLNANSETLHELENLIRFYNYYRRKFQKTRNIRCKIFRNRLNYMINNILILGNTTSPKD